MKKRKTYEISVIDKTYSKIISDETKFYTSDTALELGFELKETEYNFESAEIVLLNVDDRSLATRPVSKINNDFVYEIDDDITTHYGDWRGQLMLVENGEVHVSSPIKFRIENDLYCNKPLEITEVVSWISLKQYANGLIDELKQAVLGVEGIEDTFNENETARQTTFETNESERNATFNTNEDIRQTQELEREEAESQRQTVFVENESVRTETFNANETTRQENEDARVEAEKQREGTVSKIENRQDTVESKFDLLQQEMTDKDVISAPEIIAARGGHETLGARLDDTTSQLARTPTQITINSGGKVLFFGHRGASNIAPENTIPAFEYCGKLGWYGAETDIQVTADGVWVCHHDTTVDRMTNGTGNVNSMTAAELKTLTVDSGANVSQYPNLKNPTFEEYLIACKKYNLMPLAEIKADIDYTAYFKDLIDIVRKHGMEDRMSFICGSFANAESIRYLSKKVIIHLLTNGSTDSLNFVKSLGNAVADIQNINVTAQVVNAHHAIGIPVNTWGMATLSQVIQLIDMGVDYITSDNYGGF